jgi:hypothetical protein
MIACLGTEFGAIRAASPCALDQVGKNRTVMNIPPRGPDHGRTVSELQAPGRTQPVVATGRLLAACNIAGSPADVGKLIAEDTEKWAKVIRAANLKSE